MKSKSIKKEAIIQLANKKYKELADVLKEAYFHLYAPKKYRFQNLGDLVDLGDFYLSLGVMKNFEKAAELMDNFDTDVREKIPSSIFNYLDEGEWMK